MDKGKLYVELVKQKRVKEAIAIIRMRKNLYSAEEVAEILGKKSKKIVVKLEKVESKPKETKAVEMPTKSVESSSDTGIPVKKKTEKKSKK